MTQKSAKDAFNAARDYFFELAHSDAALDEIESAYTDVHLANEELINANLSSEEWDDVVLDIIDVSDTFERLLPKLDI